TGAAGPDISAVVGCFNLDTSGGETGVSPRRQNEARRSGPAPAGPDIPAVAVCFNLDTSGSTCGRSRPTDGARTKRVGRDPRQPDPTFRPLRCGAISTRRVRPALDPDRRVDAGRSA